MIFRKICFFLLFIFVSCSSNPLSEALDDWSDQKDGAYWYGTAIISKKNFNGENIHQSATSQAISDIASQIKIYINSDFERIIKEQDYVIDDSSVYILTTRVENNIEDVEIVDFKNLQDSYILFAKLSKEKFYRSIKRKSESAIEIAKNYIFESKNPTLESFQNLLKAEKEILPYIDYSIRTKINGVEVNLYSFIQKTKNDLINRIKIEPKVPKVYIKKLDYSDNLATIKVYDVKTNNLLSNIPLILNINKNFVECITNLEGECVFDIKPQYLNNDKKQNILITLDRESILQESSEYDFVINSQIEVELIPTNIFLIVEEYNLDTNSEQKYIAPKVKDFFIKRYPTTFVDNLINSDISIKIYATTRKIGSDKNEYGIYQVYSDANIYIESNGVNITDISVNDIKGADFGSFKQAGNKSLEKISKTIRKKTLPKLVEVLTQSNN